MDPNMIKVLTDDAIQAIQTEIARSAESAYKALSEKIAADICNQVSTKVTAELRGVTLFGEPPADCGLPSVDIQFFRDEHKIFSVGDGGCYTNYGRIINTDGKQWRPPGQKLTKEVETYVKGARFCEPIGSRYENDSYRVGAARAILDAYDATYAFAANNVHGAKVTAIRAEIEAELSDRSRALEEERKRLDEVTANNLVQTKLNEAQAEMLAAERAGFEYELARDREYRKTVDELETSKRQIELIKRQLAKKAARLTAKEEELAESKRALEKQRAKLDDRALLLSLGTVDDSLGSSESDD
jgi:hypothetical protein